MTRPGRIALVVVALILAAGSRALAQDADGPRYWLQFGAGYGTWSTGFLSLPVLWTASAPDVAGTFERSSGRFVHSLGIGFGRSGSIAVDGVPRTGSSSSSWLPVDYHLTWLHGGKTFGIPNLRWGLGPSAQLLRTTESVEIENGRTTWHRDRHVGAGVNFAFRWHDTRSRWSAAVRASLTAPLPGLSRWAVRSDATPPAEGGLFTGRLGLSVRVDRRMSSRWTWGAAYERDAIALFRSRAGTYSFADHVSYSTCHLAHLTGHVGYEWRRTR